MLKVYLQNNLYLWKQRDTQKGFLSWLETDHLCSEY